MADREGAITTSEAVVSGEASGPKVTVVVHPLVLLSTVDHYNRVARDTKKRVVGVLLGTRSGGDVDVEAESGAARKEIQRTFKHVSSMIGAYEAEEVGVEHLLRDVNDPTVSTLASQIKHKMAGLVALRSRLAEMKAYLEAVLAGKLPANNQIMYNSQMIFNLMPNLNVDALVSSMLVKTNDYHLAIYCAALVRCIIALHELVNNKITNKRLEEEAENPKPKDDKKKGDPGDGAKDGAKENEKPDAKADAKDGADAAKK
ncbi:proteasome structural subunit [Aureococcus anophagefferens]|uniref:Proteasome structural subunit n=1 Tax=Aureococcus anophagefferens TaxID=44056 RepID=A0ABR1FUE7_AURAN